MKYVSLNRVMHLYGSFLKTYHSAKVLSFDATSRVFGNDMDFTPFVITSQIEEETGQVLNDLQVRIQPDTERSHRVITARGIYGFGAPDFFTLPPVLEMEWLRRELDLGDEHMKVLQQLSYMFVLHIMVQIRNNASGSAYDGRSWMEYLERNGAIVEVEEIEDVPKIMTGTGYALLPVNGIKARSWNTVLLYGTLFPKLFSACMDQSYGFKELYLHLPVLLSMFMLDYYRKCSRWSKSARIDMENEIQVFCNSFDAYNVYYADAYTYGMTTNITSSDISLMRAVFTDIYEKIHQINTHIGLISFKEYQSIQGSQTVHASVRLTHMDVDWIKEIDRARKEKEDLDGQE